MADKVTDKVTTTKKPTAKKKMSDKSEATTVVPTKKPTETTSRLSNEDAKNTTSAVVFTPKGVPTPTSPVPLPVTYDIAWSDTLQGLIQVVETWKIQHWKELGGPFTLSSKFFRLSDSVLDERVCQAMTREGNHVDD